MSEIYKMAQKYAIVVTFLVVPLILAQNPNQLPQNQGNALPNPKQPQNPQFGNPGRPNMPNGQGSQGFPGFPGGPMNPNQPGGQNFGGFPGMFPGDQGSEVPQGYPGQPGVPNGNYPPGNPNFGNGNYPPGMIRNPNFGGGNQGGYPGYQVCNQDEESTWGCPVCEATCANQNVYCPQMYCGPQNPQYPPNPYYYPLPVQGIGQGTSQGMGQNPSQGQTQGQGPPSFPGNNQNGNPFGRKRRQANGQGQNSNNIFGFPNFGNPGSSPISGPYGNQMLSSYNRPCKCRNGLARYQGRCIPIQWCSYLPQEGANQPNGQPGQQGQPGQPMLPPLSANQPNQPGK